MVSKSRQAKEVAAYDDVPSGNDLENECEDHNEQVQCTDEADREDECDDQGDNDLEDERDDQDGRVQSAGEADCVEPPRRGPRVVSPYPELSAAELGRRGEEAAARFLVKRGYDLVERNWKCPAGEADIIAKDGDSIVFVEVKTRSSCDKGLPEEAVGPKKRKRYERIAGYFLSDYEDVDIPVRFDVIGVMVLSIDRALIRHHINAFGVA